MEEQEVKKNIEEYIIQDKIDTAFSILKNWTHDNEFHSAFISLWGSFNKNEKHFRKELIISYDDYILHNNRIRLALINLVGDIFSPKIEKNRKSTNFMKLGAAQMEISNFSKAIEYFENVIELIPNHIQAHLERGVALLNNSNFDKAILDFDKVILLEPDNPFALNNRGVANFQIGNTDRACRDWKTVQTLGFDISDYAIKNHCS